MSALIKRTRYYHNISRQLLSHQIVALLGPRQSGKTTLAKQYSSTFTGQVHFFDLEDSRDLARLSNPYLAFESLRGLIIIDEIQLLPDLFKTLRVLTDDKQQRQFLILGSASRDLIRQSSETLAGRIAYIEVSPFSLLEVHDVERLHLFGGFPNSYLTTTSFDWLEQYIRTFLERDIPNLGFSISPVTLRRFWSMLAHYHGNIFNASEIGRSLGLSDHTLKNYLDILCGTFMVRQLMPWFENIKKRQVKRPKIYFTDSGIFHHLMDIHTQEQLLKHPKSGASFEGFALEQVIRVFDQRTEDCYYWGIHEEAELDLFMTRSGQRFGFEFKYADAPVMTNSMTKAIQYLKLDRLYVVYPGYKDYRLSEIVHVMPIENIDRLVD